MTYSRTLTSARSCLWCLAVVTLAVTVVRAQNETFTATASLKTASGISVTAPLTVVVSQFATDADHTALLAALKAGGTAAVKEWLSKRPDAGSVQLGSKPIPIKFAFNRPTGGGRAITVATAEPIVFVGAGVPAAKATAGYELGLVLLDLASTGPGRGELAAAAKVRLNEHGAIVTEDYNAANVVLLSNVTKK